MAPQTPSAWCAQILTGACTCLAPSLWTGRRNVLFHPQLSKLPSAHFRISVLHTLCPRPLSGVLELPCPPHIHSFQVEQLILCPDPHSNSI